jgi:hypothetical protein
MIFLTTQDKKLCAVFVSIERNACMPFSVNFFKQNKILSYLILNACKGFLYLPSFFNFQVFMEVNLF